MEPVKELAIKIIHNLNSEHVKNIKSYIGLIEMSCDIVEEAYQRIKSKTFKISSQYKKQLALEICLYLLKKLEDNGLIEKDLSNKIKSFIDITDTDSIGDIIDDIIGIWNDIKVTTLKFLPCINPKKKTIRKLENIDIRYFDLPEDTFKISNI